jgi:exonuclease SbcC
LKKEKLLQEHEYDPNCKYCSDNEFVKEAHNAVAQKSSVEAEQASTLANINNISKQIDALDPDSVASQLDRYARMELSKNSITSEIANLNLEIERNKNSIHTIEASLTTLRLKRDEYEENKEAIENLETLLIQLNECHYKIKQTNNEIDKCETSTLNFVKTVGSLEQKKENLQEQKKEYTELEQEFAAYDLFMRCMHSNGIAYDIIKKKIPVINSEIAKVLANIVDFEVFFEASGNKFDIFIKHPRYDERPIEMASGAEKSLSAIAIRLALLGVSSLPTGDIFVLDEPGTALDEENMEGFIRILELIKVYFKNVLLISHLDSLKDCVDMQIVIDKKAGFAKVNQ